MKFIAISENGIETEQDSLEDLLDEFESDGSEDGYCLFLEVADNFKVIDLALEREKLEEAEAAKSEEGWISVNLNGLDIKVPADTSYGELQAACEGVTVDPWNKIIFSA